MYYKATESLIFGILIIPIALYAIYRIFKGSKSPFAYIMCVYSLLYGIYYILFSVLLNNIA